jgi:hypothetical protein
VGKKPETRSQKPEEKAKLEGESQKLEEKSEAKACPWAAGGGFAFDVSSGFWLLISGFAFSSAFCLLPSGFWLLASGLSLLWLLVSGFSTPFPSGNPHAAPFVTIGRWR